MNCNSLERDITFEHPLFLALGKVMMFLLAEISLVMLTAILFDIHVNFCSRTMVMRIYCWYSKIKTWVYTVSLGNIYLWLIFIGVNLNFFSDTLSRLRKNIRTYCLLLASIFLGK